VTKAIIVSFIRASIVLAIDVDHEPKDFLTVFNAC
jgi:hypothetical protein